MSPSELVTALGPQMAMTVALAAPILGLRRIALHRLASGETVESTTKAARIRVVSNLSLTLILGFVWIAELQSLLLSVTAVLMALVLATKELIQCGTGSLMRAAGGSFRIGDQVEFEGTRGRVAALSLLTTTIEETDGRSLGSRPTGRRLVVPNSRLFSGVHVEDRNNAVRRHVVSLTLEEKTPALRDLLRQADAIAARHSAENAPLPCVAVGTTEFGKIRLEIVLFCRPGEIAVAEREITLDLLDAIAMRGAGVPDRRPALTLVEREVA